MPLPLACFLLCLAAALFGVWAEHRGRSAFQKYATVGLKHPTTGGAAAGAICLAARTGVIVLREGKFLELRYHRGTKELRLSAETHDGRSITSIAKGIHEAGHALQDAQRYPWLGFRSGRVSVDNMATRYWFWVLLIGFYIKVRAPEFASDFASDSMPQVANIADTAFWALSCIVFVLCAAAVLVQLAGLRVGIDAAERAKAVLRRANIPATDVELQSIRAVLDAVPWFYAGVALKAFFWIHRHGDEGAGTSDGREFFSY